MALFGATGGAEQALTIVIRARNEALGQLQKTQEQLDKFKKSNAEVLQTTQRVSGIATVAIGALGLAAVKAASDMEQTRIAFDTMLGSAQKGGAFLKDLYDFAKRTPFTITSIEEAGKKLLAYNIAQSEVIPTLKTLGDIAAGVGTDKFPQLVLAYGQVRAAGKLYGTELRQFTETGVPLIDALARHFGVATSEIRNMVEDGKVGFNDMQAALQSLSGEGGKFANLMEEQATTLGGMWSNLQDSWTLFLRNAGTQMLPFAKALVGGLTEVVRALQSWTSEHPRLSTAIFLVTGATTGLVFALSSLALVLPKIIGFFRAGMAMMLATNPVILALAAAVGVVMYKLIQFGDQVGGIGRAWNLTVLQMEISFWSFVRGVLNGIDTITQYIPFLSGAVGGAIDSVNARIGETQGMFDALAVEGFQAAATSAEDMGGISVDAFDQMGMAATAASEEVKRAAEAVAETEKRITDLQKSYLGDLIDARYEYAEAYVEQEQKVKDLKKQIREIERKDEEDQDRKRLRELEDQLATEQEALNSASTIKKQLAEDVSEARRRASLTDFEREIEDIGRRTAARQVEFNEKMVSLQKELAANQAKAAGIQASEKQTTVVVSQEVNKREKDTIASVNRQIKAYENLAEASTLGKKSFDFGFSTANSTPMFRGFATGGVVDGPIGSPRLIMAHGGERVIPNGGSSPDGGGDTFVFNFPNLTVRSREDIGELRKLMEKAWRDVPRVHKLSTI